MTKYLLFMILVLATFLAVSVKNCQDIRTDRNRLSDNQRTLLADIEFYRTKDSLSVASVERLTLTNREFRKYAGELKKTVEELNLKVKHLQSASQSATEIKYLVKTEIRYSIIILIHLAASTIRILTLLFSAVSPESNSPDLSKVGTLLFS